MNYISFWFNEIKSFIVDFHDLYYSNDWDDDTPRKSVHSYYTMHTFFDIMGSYDEDEIQKVNVEIFEYIYNAFTNFLTNIQYFIYMNPFVDLDNEDNNNNKVIIILCLMKNL